MTKDYSVRVAEIEDLRALIDIDSSLGQSEKELVHKTSILEGRVRVIVGGEGNVLGYLRYGSFLWDYSNPFLQMLRIRDDARGIGLGTILLNGILQELAVEAAAKQWSGVYSSTDEKNEASIQLHKKFGFEDVGTFKIAGQDVKEVLFFKGF